MLRAINMREATMQDLDEFTVTDAALAQMTATENPRLKQILDAAVRHRHAFRHSF
jgi:hydroxyquinol 1,2-dioxygenase